MRRTALAGLSLLALSACAQTAPGVSRAADLAVVMPMTGQQVVLSGEMTTSRIPVGGSSTEPRHDLVIRANGQTAISGNLVTYGVTTLEGYAGTMPLAAACRSRELARADRQFDCGISLNGQPVGTMSFRATPTGPMPPVVGG
ncbi:hypothetical protein KPL78_12490 [Roseomonas sp. HJA6]|uniref:Lipoprotein n=1 Tax=Roseomonas alba TaxID=2846776 RepID=A0ABS7A8P5_9PROT|nr:hypothetical protein [Neoroseomonas alba]MBW6398673.1 hypothetical protein [Neoroseomonas alba]